jgi:hypothetical protein
MQFEFYRGTREIILLTMPNVCQYCDWTAGLVLRGFRFELVIRHDQAVFSTFEQGTCCIVLVQFQLFI